MRIRPAARKASERAVLLESGIRHCGINARKGVEASAREGAAAGRGLVPGRYLDVTSEYWSKRLC